MNVVSKKTIKEIKRNVVNYGAMFEGYYYTITDVINYDDMLEVFEYSKDTGVDLASLSECDRLNYIITALANRLNYREFKKFIPHFIGFSNIYYNDKANKVYIS